MTAAFVIFFQPDLKADSKEDTAALLRVLIYKRDNTTFGGVAPAIPQWNGATGETLGVLILAYIALMIQVASVVFAILAKQMLHLYALKTVWGGGSQKGTETLRKMILAVIIVLPLLLQFSVAIFSVAVGLYMIALSSSIAGIMFATLGLFGIIYIVFIYLGFSTARILGATERAEETGQQDVTPSNT